MAELTPLPKFAGPQNGQGPQTISDWLAFWRFLFSLWTKAKASTTDQQVETLIPAPMQSRDSSTALTAAWSAAATAEADKSALRASSMAILAGVDTARPPGNLSGFLLMNEFPPTMPPRLNPNDLLGVVVQGTHDDRYSVGTGTIAGNVLTWVSGPNFRVNWVGSTIAINGGLYVITVWTDATHITVAGAPPAGAVGWEFMLYPANTLPVGSAFMETDHKVIYHNAASSGTGNLNLATYTWVSGPLFSPYWGGLQININGINYVVAFSTETTLTLTASSGLVTGGLAWTVQNSSWYYETGIESLSFASFAARTWTILDDQYTCNVYDFNHQITYNGVGAAWGFANGDAGSKYVVPSADGSVPTGGPWQFCDGSTVTVFEIIAGVPTLVNVATPDLRSDTFLRGGTFTGTPDVTTAPAFNPAGLTFTGTPAVLTGTVAAPVFTGSAAVLTGTNSAPTFTGNALGTHTHSTSHGQGFITNAFGTGGAQTVFNTFTVTGAAGSFAPTLTSATSAGTPSGTVSAPALTMDSYTPAGTNSAPTLTMNSYTPAGTIGGTGAVAAPVVGAGAPRSFALLFYMRR